VFSLGVVLYFVTGSIHSFAFEEEPWTVKESSPKSAMELLQDLLSDLETFEQGRAVEALGPNLSVAQDATAQARKLYNSKSSQKGEETEKPESFGNIRLPMAKVVEEDFLNSALQIQKQGDLGGSPFGALVGKSTFGKSSQDQSIQSLIQNRDENLADSPATVENDFVEIYDSLTQEQMIEVQTRLENVRNEMDKLSLKLEPYQETDYKAYENAKQLFKKNEKLISKIPNFEEGFIRNAQELFGSFSWRDQDKVGKLPYEKFIERQERKIVFPDPKEPETTPKTHQGMRSH
jgi:DNA repair exonuclease SbcCD ATPase subunit